jgi:hypothetical protein
MIRDMRKLTVTMEQMERIIHALDDLRDNVLPKDPSLFATMAEAPLDDLNRLRSEVNDYVREMKIEK